MVGTEVGQVYKGKQGEGFATTFDQRWAAELGLQQKAGRAKAKEAHAEKTEEMLPGEVWHFYNNEVAKEMEGIVGEGAKLMAETGSANLWEDTADYARNWREVFSAARRGADNINQYEAFYKDAMKAVAAREDEYDPAYLTELQAFPFKHTKEDLAAGQVQFPFAKMKNPGELYSKLYVADADAYGKTLKPGEEPDAAAVRDRILMFMQDPSHDAEAVAAQQMYEMLPDDKKAYFADRARASGLPQPWMAHAEHNYMGRLSKTEVDLNAEAVKFAAGATMREYGSSIQDLEGVTKGVKSVKFANDNFPREAARSYFRVNDHLLDNENAMAQFGISMENTPSREGRRAAAELEMARRIKANEKRKFEDNLRRRAGAGAGQQEQMESFDLWRQTIGSMDDVVANEAAQYIYSTKIAGQKPISNATVIDMEEVIPASQEERVEAFRQSEWYKGRFDFEEPSGSREPLGRALEVTFADQTLADKLREEFLKTRYDPAEIELTAGERNQISARLGGDYESPEYQSEVNNALRAKQEAYGAFVDDLKRRSVGNTVAIPLFGWEHEQILKTLHDETARQKKRLYESQIPAQKPFELETVPQMGGPLKLLSNGN